MDWTKETPTREGAYWVRHSLEAESPWIMEVWIDTSHEGDHKLCAGYGDDYELLSRYIEMLGSDLEWYGPLEPPTTNEC